MSSRIASSVRRQPDCQSQSAGETFRADLFYGRNAFLKLKDAAASQVLHSTIGELSLKRIRRELEKSLEAVDEASIDRLVKYSCPFTRASRKNLIKRTTILTTAAAAFA